MYHSVIDLIAMFSKRSQKVDISGIRRVFDLAATLINPINLSIGQPDFPTPEPLIDAACRAMVQGKNGYSQTQGIAALRDKIRNRYGLSATNQRDVFVTSGVSGALLLSYLALLDPGDEILVPDPFFCAYRDVAYIVNSEPVFYNCYPNFSPDLNEMEKLITPRTKAILINSPANPTGYVLSEEEMENIVKLAARHDLWLISDEIYEFFTYDSPKKTLEGRYEKLIVLNGFSKSLAVTGWRLGFVVGPSSFIAEIQKLQQYTFVCAPTPLQWAVAEDGELNLEKYLLDYRKKRDLLCQLLDGVLPFVKPSGAFYIFAEAPGGSGEKFVELCISKNLLVVPGAAFSRKDTHFRISFAAPEDKIRAGAAVITELAHSNLARIFHQTS